MAVIPLKYADTNSFVWSNMQAGDTGAPAGRNRLPDKTFQFIGAVTSGSIEGSNNGIDYNQLTTVDGLPATVSSAGFLVIRENPLYIRPVITTGSDVTVIASGAA